MYSIDSIINIKALFVIDNLDDIIGEESLK